MDAYVVVATKGRPTEVSRLVAELQYQTVQPSLTVVVGTSALDIDQVRIPQRNGPPEVICIVAEHPGSCSQRNLGIDKVLDYSRNEVTSEFFIVFFDDDFWPSRTWLENCRMRFQASQNVVGITGKVLADGAHGKSISQTEAVAYLNGRIPPRKHWASGDVERPIDALYGCNMAFRSEVFDTNKFDENLPLYGWQEDQDFTSLASRQGTTIYTPYCIGVHLGVKSGRVSGKKFGYSQIANPFYLFRKGTMRRSKGYKFVARHIASNIFHSITRNPAIDYRGRLLGNFRAILDLLRGHCHPTKILNLE